MPVYLRQSTAVDLAIGPFLDATDGVTAETGLTLSQADVRLKKNNAAWGQVSDNTSATHEEFGWYEKEFDATDTNTVGRLLVSVQEAGALPVWHEFWVLEEAVYDALFAASAAGYASQASVDTIDDFLDTEVAAIKAKTDNLPSDPADASDIATATTAISGYIDTEVAAILAAVDTEVAAIKAKTDNLPASPAAVGSAMTLDGTQAFADDATSSNKLSFFITILRSLANGRETGVSGVIKNYGLDDTTQVGRSRTVSGTVPSNFERS